MQAELSLVLVIVIMLLADLIIKAPRHWLAD